MQSSSSGTTLLPWPVASLVLLRGWDIGWRVIRAVVSNSKGDAQLAALSGSAAAATNPEVARHYRVLVGPEARAGIACKPFLT